MKESEIMNEQIFRKKSIDRVSSPEELNQYIKTTKPSVWLFLAAVIILLVGTIVWSATGHIYSGAECGVSVVNGRYSCYVSEETFSKMTDKSFPKVDESEGSIPDSITGPTQIDAELYDENYNLHVAGLNIDDWCYEVCGAIDLPDGKYKGEMIFESLSPITFIFN